MYPSPWNILALFAAKTLGSIGVWVICRYYMSKERKKSFLRNDTVGKINSVIEESPIYYGTLVRYAGLPTSVKNYGLGVMNISFTNYMICCALGSVVFVPIQAGLGSNLILMVQGKAPKVSNPMWVTLVVCAASILLA